MASKSKDAFRTISEVADWLGVQPHVLRFWESKFSQVKPVKRAGGRRYYRPNDMRLLGGIRKLLHEDGLTIKGVQKLLREDGVAHVSSLSAPLDDEVDTPQPDTSPQPAAQAQPAETEQESVAPSNAVESHDDPQDAAEDTALPAFLTGRGATIPSGAPHGDAAPEPDARATQDAEHAEQEAAQAQTQTAETAETAETEAPAPQIEEAASQDQSALDLSAQETPEPPAPPQDQPDTQAEDGKEPNEPNATETAAPVRKPRIIAAPDPDETSFDLAPALLSAAFETQHLSAEQKIAATPFVARLAALRDRMASER